MTKSVASAAPVSGAAATCAPMGDLQYVVESRHHGSTETWFVVKPHQGLAGHYAALGVELSPDCRVVVEAASLRPVGVLPQEILSAPPSPAGFNPYFDVPPT
jgi:hypothetical protein